MSASESMLYAAQWAGYVNFMRVPAPPNPPPQPPPRPHNGFSYVPSPAPPQGSMTRGSSEPHPNPVFLLHSRNSPKRRNRTGEQDFHNCAPPVPPQSLRI